MTSVPRLTTLIAVAVTLLVAAGAAHAKQTPEQKCQKARYDAGAQYASCQQKLLGKLFGGSVRDYVGKFLPALSKCRVKYTDTWAKLQKKARGTGAICDNSRYDTSVAGTVTDRLTGLQWEQKTDDATVHDKDDIYTWTAGVAAADGTAFTSFLSQLNFPFGCFAGQCDWRLPTIYELQTIVLESYPCLTSPCIDQAVFGPTIASDYWSATTDASSPDYAWDVNFYDGNVFSFHKGITYYVRAVRAGL